MGSGYNHRLGFAVAAATLGSAFQHGFNMGGIIAPISLMIPWMKETNYNRTGKGLEKYEEYIRISWIVTIYVIGGIIGGAATGLFSRLGPKCALLINNIFAIIAAFLIGLCKMAGYWEMILAARFIIGINNGLNSGLCPMYLSEIAPTCLRGSIGTVYQLVVSISILFANIMGLDYFLGTADLWPILLALTALPAIFQLVTLPKCPESPKFLLIVKEDQVVAQRALSWLRNSSNVHVEMEEMIIEAETGKSVPSCSLDQIFSLPVLVSVMMMMAQKLSGFSLIIFHSYEWLSAAGVNYSEATTAALVLGCLMPLTIVISLFLVDIAGRKMLMLFGMIGMMIICILLIPCEMFLYRYFWISQVAIGFMLLFVAMFGIGPASIPWFLVTEVVPQNARPMASSIAVAANWTADLLIGFGINHIHHALGPCAFLVPAALLAFFITFTWFKVPETKGKRIDEITEMFKQQEFGGTAVLVIMFVLLIIFFAHIVDIRNGTGYWNVLYNVRY